MQSIWSIQYDMIYLAACGVNKVKLSEQFLTELKNRVDSHETFETKNGQRLVYMDMLYYMSRSHSLDALVGSTLKQAGIRIPKKWAERISKSVRKNILFDAERKKLCDFMDSRGIWYMPLKGVILKDYYPAVGMRQMSDNDILFDDNFCDEIEEYMTSQGYEAVSVGVGNHDVYQKEPVLNFEMHRALYGKAHDRKWEEYYRDVKKRLIRENDTSYGYHFRDEDFYVYILCHAYKHYAGCGTGLRTLLDFYVYLLAEEQELDFAYIEKECEVLGIGEFEKMSRSMCKKVFSIETEKHYDAIDATGEGEEYKPLERIFAGRLTTEEELEMLSYYLSSGVYGTNYNFVSNMVKKKGRAGFFISRIFMPLHEIKNFYPVLERAPYLLPVCWVVRIVKMLLVKERRNHAVGQLLEFVKVVKSKNI